MTLAEVVTGKAAGFLVGYLLNLFVLPHLVQAPVAPEEALAISIVYMGAATVRSMISRRIFEWLRVDKGIN